MGRPPCCDGTGVKKGPWTPEEDKKLLDYIQMRGDGNWRQLPKLAGLNRCGKSCRLRWANYLRPDIKRGGFSEEEERLIVQLHSELGNKWSVIATNLQGRTDNEIKNHWNTHLRKKLLERGIDPVTHRPRTDLNPLASLPDLLATANLQGNSTGSWDSALRLRANAAYLARLQLLQGLLQIITNRSPPNLDAMAPFGSAALGNYQFNDLLQLHRHSGGIENGRLGPHDPIPMPVGFSNQGLIQGLANNFQARTESSLSLDGVSSPELVGSGGGSSAPFINPTANSTPSSVSHSPEITINDQVQDLTSPSPSEGLNLDNLDDNLSWKDILDQISWLDGAA